MTKGRNESRLSIPKTDIMFMIMIILFYVMLCYVYFGQDQGDPNALMNASFEHRMQKL